MLLKDLRQNVAQLKGLGAKACENLVRLDISHISQLLQHYPVRYLNHLQPSSLQQAWQDLQGSRNSGNLHDWRNLDNGKTVAAPENRQGRESYLYCLAEILEHSYIPWHGGFSAQKRQRDPHAGQTLKITIGDGSGVGASLLCFGRNFLAGQLPVGSQILVAGKFQLRYGELQCSSFIYEIPQFPNVSGQPVKAPLAAESGAYNGSEFGCILPLYPLTQGISQKQLRSAIAQALQHFSFALEDELPEALQRKYQLLSKKDALRQIHFPADKDSLARAHRSLVYEELLILMLLIQRRRLQQHRNLQRQPLEVFCLPNPSQVSGLAKVQAQSPILEQAQRSLPFKLSDGQCDALGQILESFRLDVPMNRLLQGDVGSGKTIVALLSALPWLEAGAQVVLMAPTEILARQLLQNFETLRRQLEIANGSGSGQNFLQSTAQLEERLGRCGFLSASVSGSKRRELLRQLRSGEIRLLVGTHALFSQAVEFAQLRYIIVDEQHRFGVEQRLALKHKAPQPPHVLLMSATPIPRSLALTLYGDLDISTIRSMPAERKPIKTHLVRQGNDQKMYHFVQQELAAGRQAYFIYPLIAETEVGRSAGNHKNFQDDDYNANDGELRSIEKMEQQLRQVFSQYRLANVHGQMSQAEKDEVMEAFRANEVQLLLATTVVEVGVDVPNASVMVVEHAERFGLAQLHQLRGRVGRSSDQGYCFLVYQDQPALGKNLSALAKERLLTLKDSSDGFAISEKDLELRGPGDLLGAEQSGSMDLRIAKIPADLELLEHARLDAAEILKTDYALLQPANQGLRQALLSLSLESPESLDA